VGVPRAGLSGAAAALGDRLVAFATLLGAGGIAFGYFVVLPAAIHFLTNYDSSYYTIQLRAKDYYRFVSFVLVGVAIAFEVPVFVLGLVRLRIVTAAQLRHTWRYGIFVMTVIGVILPGVDPVTTILTVLPLVALYALSIALATFFEPRWRAARTPPSTSRRAGRRVRQPPSPRSRRRDRSGTRGRRALPAVRVQLASRMWMCVATVFGLMESSLAIAPGWIRARGGEDLAFAWW
jgi:hypothetical protein